MSESYSGDGLIAASFNSLDHELIVNISYARAKESLFGEQEYDLAKQMDENRLLQNINISLNAENELLKNDLGNITQLNTHFKAENETLSSELEIIKSKLPEYANTFFSMWYRMLRNFGALLKRSFQTIRRKFFLYKQG